MESELSDVIQKCNSFRMNDWLYLTEGSRKAFDEAAPAASMHQNVKQEERRIQNERKPIIGFLGLVKLSLSLCLYRVQARNSLLISVRDRNYET
jgi:hypothetical protein